MNLRDLDVQEIIAGQIRDLQARFHVEHEALTNWGLWGRDRSGIFPVLTRPKMFDHYIHDETEGYGEISPEDERAAHAQIVVKAERSEEADYDEKQAVMLDERIHSSGGLPEYLRICIRTAYVDGGPREARWHAFANCSTPDQFLERLQASLQFVSRFA